MDTYMLLKMKVAKYGGLCLKEISQRLIRATGEKIEQIKDTAANIKRLHKEKDRLEQLQKEDISEGANIYNTYCAFCHQRNGKGASGRYPPFTCTKWVYGGKSG